MNYNESKKIIVYTVTSVIGFLVIALLIGNIISNTIIEQSKLCAEQGCISSHRPNSRYCYDHDPDIAKERLENKRSNSPLPYRNSGNVGNTERNNTSTPKYSGGFSGGYNYSEKYKTYDTNRYPINDPLDYDNPEDYADDAFGEDFDSWNEAYDYWEDY